MTEGWSGGELHPSIIYAFNRQSISDGAVSKEDFDFAVVCSGMYGTPSMPKLPGAESFGGKVLHSSQFTDR